MCFNPVWGECSSSRPPAISHSLEAVLGLALWNLTLIARFRSHWTSQAAFRLLCTHCVCLPVSTPVPSSTYSRHLGPAWSDLVSSSLPDYCGLHVPTVIPCEGLLTLPLYSHHSPVLSIIRYLKTLIVCASSLFSNFTVILNIVASASFYPYLAPFPFPLPIGNH